MLRIVVNSAPRPLMNWREIWSEGRKMELYCSWDVQRLNLEENSSTDIFWRAEELIERDEFVGMVRFWPFWVEDSECCVEELNTPTV